jgi:hypothetical protein
MSFYRLFMSLALIVLLVPAGTAWAGGSDVGFLTETFLAERECSLMHVCRGGGKPGQECTVEVKDGAGAGGDTCEESGKKSACPDGRCVVKYVPAIIIPGILTIIADDTIVADQPDLQQECAARTILLRVRADDQPLGRATTRDDGDHNEQFDDRADDQSQVLANTALVEDIFGSNPPSSLERRLSWPATLSQKFLYRQADRDFEKKLIDLFGLNEKQLAGAVPVVARVGKPIIEEDHSDKIDISGNVLSRDPLGSVVSLQVGIRFAIPIDKFFQERDNMPCPTDPKKETN